MAGLREATAAIDTDEEALRAGGGAAGWERQLCASSMRCRASGVTMRLQTARGMTPNMPPASRAIGPARSSRHACLTPVSAWTCIRLFLVWSAAEEYRTAGEPSEWMQRRRPIPSAANSTPTAS